MPKVAIVSDDLMLKLIEKVESLEKRVIQELDRHINPYLTTKDVQVMLKKSENWVTLHKHDLGCSKRTGTLRFKRKDIEAYIDEDYFRKESKLRTLIALKSTQR